MSVFFCQLCALFCLKLQKNAAFAMCCEISIAEVRLRFNLVRKCRSAIVELRCASTESKSLLRKLRCASEIKKKLIAHFALRFHWLKRSLRFVALRFVALFDIMLFVPTTAVSVTSQSLLIARILLARRLVNLST